MRLSSRLSRLDRRVFAMVASARLPGLERVVPALSRAADNSLLWAGVAGAFAVSGRRPLRRAATRGLLAVSLASPLVNLVGKQAFRRNRPSAEGLPLARMIKMPTSASFPSGHSASAAAFAAAVAMEAPRAVAVPVALLAAAVCFSRVYTGVHYPGDVLAGAGIGVAAGLLTRRVWPDGVPRRVWMVFVGNCRYEARGGAPVRRQRLEDGLLDIRVLDAADRLPRVRVFLSLLAARMRLSRHYQHWQADTLRLSAPSGRLSLARDGETFTVTGEAEFTKRPRSLLVIRLRSG